MLGSLIKDCDIEALNSDMQMVKNASMFTLKGVTYIKHYSTIIFAHDANKGITEADFNCSMTSNRQIRYALNYFGIPEASVINTHEGSKMNYSGGFV